MRDTFLHPSGIDESTIMALRDLIDQNVFMPSNKANVYSYVLTYTQEFSQAIPNTLTPGV